MTQEFVTLPREVVEHAMEALEHAEKDCADFQRVNIDQICDAATALRAALEQPQGEQEPVAWCALNADRSGIAYFDGRPIIMTGPIGNEHHPDPLYTKPQPKRDPLTDKQISRLWSDAHNDTTERMAFQVLARAIEAAHNIK